MTSRAPRSPARVGLSRLPGWLTALGVVLVLGELTCGAVLLAAGPGGLAALGGAQRTVVLKVDGACSPDSATYTTPTGNGHFDITLGRSDGEMDCFSHGGFTGPVLTKTVPVRAGGTVTISISNRVVFPLTCSIMVNGSVLNQVAARDGGESGTCRARIP